MLENIKFTPDGLVPVIAQQYDSKDVLMMAWMNEEAIEKTISEQHACYWSRSRNKIWRKGESSGNTQKLIEFRYDCDGDTILLLVDQKGPACHTNRPNCFFNSVDNNGNVTIISKPVK